MKILKSILKWFLIVVVVLGLLLFIAAKVMSEKRPATNPSEAADALAKEMLMAMNKPAWDSLKYLKWEFMRGHQYVWDKQNNLAQISWGDKRVLIDLDEVDGVAFEGNTTLEGEAKSKAIQQAWTIWCNDSFWMFAPFKAFDPGTQRTLVDGEGGQGLMVSYESGGVTPGDAYLWKLGEDKIPDSYKMWTFLPIKGLEMSWDKWITLQGGAKVSTAHSSSLMSFEMKGVEEARTLSEFGLDDSLFQPLL